MLTTECQTRGGRSVEQAGWLKRCSSRTLAFPLHPSQRHHSIAAASSAPRHPYDPRGLPSITATPQNSTVLPPYNSPSTSHSSSNSVPLETAYSPSLCRIRSILKMDQRGFLFVLPRLGLPDPQGDWQVVKAAIGVKAEVVQLVVNSEIAAPLRPPVAFSHTAFAPVEIGRVIAAGTLIPAIPLPANTEWVFVPMHVYHEQMAMVASPFSPLTMATQTVYSGGTVEDVKKWQRNSEKAGREVTDEEAAEGDILDSAWDAELHRKILLATVRQGDRSLPTTRPLFTLLRAHPAPDGDFRGLDYAVIRVDRAREGRAVSEQAWRRLPANATRADGERKFVNLVRMLVSKTAFSKEEWPAVRAAQWQQGSSSGRA